VTGDMIRKLVDIELRDINRSDIAAFYSGQTLEKYVTRAKSKRQTAYS
jgi:hypothetical protein